MKNNELGRESRRGWRTWIMIGVCLCALASHAGMVVANGVVAGSTIYVDHAAVGDNDGTSWDNAFVSLQSGLATAAFGDEIWVAEGTHKPSAQTNPTDSRTATFQMKNGVAIYGGFDPSVGDDQFEERDPFQNQTILSGDIGVIGNSADNCYHVFYHPSGLGLNSSALLDGFTITQGNADGPDDHGRGGGMHNNGSSPSVVNCTLSGNLGERAGGMYNYESAPAVTDCTFISNSAPFYPGGGMFNDQSSSPTVRGCFFEANEAWAGGGIFNQYGSSPEVVNCVFSGNRVDFDGAAIHNTVNSSPKVTNCTFYDNRAGRYGGGMYNENHAAPVITNCILWGDTPEETKNFGTGSSFVSFSDVQGGHVGTGNINMDPKFANAILGDFHLLGTSPCIGSGTDFAAGVTIPSSDFEGEPRPFDGDGNGVAIADMGADEHASPVDPIPEMPAAVLLALGLLGVSCYACLRIRSSRLRLDAVT